MVITEFFSSLPTEVFAPAWFSAGPQEMMIVGIIALLLFGKRLPEVARNLGKGFSEFKKGMQGFEDEVRHSSRPSTYSGNSSSSANRPLPKDASAEEEDDEFAAPKFSVDE